MDTNEATTDSGRAEHDGDLMAEPEPAGGGALVEILPGLLIAYGEIDLRAFDGAQVLDVDVTASPDLTGVAAGALTGANLVAQGVQSALSARGLVRLAPETLQALKAARPVASGGWYLGTLTSEAGRFAQSVRWLPATSAQAVTVLAGLGPAVALAAISAQASALASTVGRIESKIDALRAEMEARDLDKLRALLSRVEEVRDEVSQFGFQSVAARRRIDALAENRDLDEMYGRFLRRAGELPDKSMQSATALIGARGRVASDLGALIAVWQARDLVGVMSIGALIAEDEEENLRRHRVQSLQSDLARRHQEVTKVVSSVRLQAHLLLIQEENPGRVKEASKRVEGAMKGVAQRIPIVQGASDAPTLGDVVGMIDKVTGSDQNVLLAVPEPLTPEIQDADAKAASSLCEALRWLLPVDESLLALVEAVEADRGEKTLVVTSRRWGLVALSNLTTTSADDALSPLEDLRYVIDSGLKDSQRSVDVVTRERVVTVKFKKVEDGTDRSSAVDRTLSLLRTAMNLPDDEREHDPLLDQPRPTSLSCAASGGV